MEMGIVLWRSARCFKKQDGSGEKNFARVLRTEYSQELRYYVRYMSLGNKARAAHFRILPPRQAPSCFETSGKSILETFAFGQEPTGLPNALTYSVLRSPQDIWSQYYSVDASLFAHNSEYEARVRVPRLSGFMAVHECA